MICKSLDASQSFCPCQCCCPLQPPVNDRLLDLSKLVVDSLSLTIFLSVEAHF